MFSVFLETSSAVTGMYLDIVVLSQVRERQISYDITYTWNLKKWYVLTYLQNRNRLIDTENKFVVTKGDMRGSINQGFEMNRYTLLQVKLIKKNKVLLYSTGNYIQYLIITYNGKESEEDTYICVYVCV